MQSKPKTLDISNVKYAMASELGENHAFLERLAEAGKIGKVIWNGNNYYEVEKTRRVAKDLRTIPAGYVRAIDHAILIGSTSQSASELCNKANAPAKKVIVNGTKAAWFCDKAWLEKHLGKSSPIEPKTKTKAKPSKTPAQVTNNVTIAPSIAELQATVAELRTAIQNLTRGHMTPKTAAVTEEIAREQGYRPLLDLSKELDVEPSTLRGWQHRNAVRAYKVSGRVFLNVEDCERMYIKLDDNRAMLSERMRGKTNNGMNTSQGQNGVS